MHDAGPLLAIDTSGATASVAIYRDQILAEAFWQSGRGHSSQLLPTIQAMLSLARVDRKEISVVAVAAGPGSYSGLRVGVSTAMGLAVALGIGVAQVPTLDVIAWSLFTLMTGDGKRPVRAAIEIGRGRYATDRFHRAGQHMESDSRIQNVGLGELVEMVSAEHSVLAVDLDPQAREHIAATYGPRVEVVPPAASARRAGFLAELAALRIRRGESVGSSVEPIYLQ
jgi:tRNA threonylcarbamoyladenosine biosynthesis protein TsaB